MSVLGKILVKLGLDNSEFKKGIDDSERNLGGFSSTLKDIGGKIAAAFAVERLLAFGKEISEIAARAEGVRKAFMQIGDESTLQGLRTATKGMVDDLTLMQTAVKASNFNIPLSELGKYLSFAAERAAATGQSVDYLVDSIITGLGRESVMILDNLGLSVVDIRKEMEKGGTMAEAVGRMIDRTMKNSTSVIGDTARETANLSTEWKNFKEQAGGELNKILTPILKTLNDIIDKFKEMKKEAAENPKEPTGWDRLWDKLVPGSMTRRNIRVVARDQAYAASVMKDINSVEEAKKRLDEALAVKNVGTLEDRVQTGYLIIALKNYIATTDKAASTTTNKGVKSIQQYKDSIAALQKTIEETTDADERRKAVAELGKEQAGLKSLLGGLGITDEKNNGRGEIPQKEAEIESLRNKLKNASGEERQQIVDAIALRQQELAILRMTTAEKVKVRNEKAIQTPSMTGFDINAKWQEGGKLKATDPFTAWLEGNKASRQGAIDEYTQDMAAVDALSQQFIGAVQQGMIGSFDALSSALAGVGDMDAAAVVSAIISPLADMAISAGTLIMLTGQGIESLKTALMGFFGVGAIAAGAILVGFGIAAKTGLKAISKGGKGKAGTASTTSFSGGGAVSGYSGAMATTSAMNINVTGRISGSDIVLSYDKTKDNKSR